MQFNIVPGPLISQSSLKHVFFEIAMLTAKEEFTLLLFYFIFVLVLMTYFLGSNKVSVPGHLHLEDS